MACTTQKRIVLPPVCMPPGCPPPCCPSPCCPPKRCPPPCCPPPCCPPPCCPPPYCPPPCCPPPCCPSPCCPPPCCPPPCYPGCFPCMPSCPPSCCPPACPKPCCGPKAPCCPKPPCCPCPPACCRPVNLCNCCGGKSTIVCVPKGCPPSCCCGPCGPQCCSPCCLPSCCPPAAEDKPASFNNCNFYCSDLPKGLRGGPSNNVNDCYADPCCGGEDECCYDGMNRAAGDDHLAPIPRSGRTSSTSGSRHGGSGTNHANGNGQHNHLRNQRGNKKNRSGYKEEEYEEYVSPPRSSSSPSKRSDSSSGNYSYSKSTKSSDPSKQKALKVANVSKNKEKGSETAHKLMQSRNHKHISAQGTRYTTFADQLHSPKGVNFARGDVRTKRNELRPDCPKDPIQRNKIKLEDIVFPVRSLTRKSTTEKTKVVSPDIQACVAQPAGDQQCVQNEATKSKESSSKDQTSPVLSSQFSTHKIFAMGKLLDGVSSSTISAPPTKYTPVNHSASNHSILTPHRNSKSNSFLRHSKSLEIFKQNEPEDLELIKQSGHFHGKGEIRALLKTAALEHMKAPPLQVMTCLIERARLEDSKRFVVMLQPGFKRQTTADDLTSAPSNITGCTSARKALPSGFKSQEFFKSSITEKSQSNGTMQSFCSSGMVAHPPSARLGFPFNNHTSDDILHEVKSIRTVTLPLIQQASRHEQSPYAIEKDTALPTQQLTLQKHIFHSDHRKPSPILIAPTRFPRIQSQLGFAVNIEGVNGKSDGAEVSTGVSLPPLAHINCVGKTHGESCKVEFEKVACPLLRRKRKARRILVSNDGFWSGDGAQTFPNYKVKS